MPDGNLIDIIITGAGAVVGYFVKTTRDDNKEQDRKIEQIQREQTTLLSRAEFRDDMRTLREEMRDGFNKVFDRLDQKADK